MRLTTSKCGQYKHREFVLEANEAIVPVDYLQQIVTILEEMVASGSAFEPQETFQVGWMPTLIQACGPGCLTLFEPDMISLPVEWVPGITNTLRQMMLQLFMLDSVNLRNQIDFPNIRKSLITCNRYSETNFFMHRQKPSSESDSGWFIGCLDQTHCHNNTDNLNCISVYEAMLHQKALQGFAAFPVDSMIVISERGGISFFKDGNEVEIQPNSFLDEWFAMQKR